jgi:subtilase family serine protease
MTRLLSHFGRRSELVSRLLVLVFVAVPFPAPSFEILERWSPDGSQLGTPLAEAALTAPNLVPTALTAPASATPNQNISISWTVANQGNGPAQPAWHDVLYLSTDAACCGSVVTVVKDAYHMTTLAAGASYTNFDTAARVPQAPAGHYYLILVIDDTNAVSESNESDNQRAVPITITTPDLVPTAFTVPTAAVAGSSISISWTVTNQGSGIAAPGADNVYFSDTPTCCDDVAVFLGGAGGPPALSPGASYSRTKTVTIPTSLTILRDDRWMTSDVRAGTYYLMLRVDSNSFVYEADETNNLRIVPITITTPDLVPTVLSAPPSASTQQAISISWTVANQGTGPAQQPWTDAVYLSTGPAVCGFPREGDILLTSTIRTVALAPGGSYTGTRTGVLVPSVPAGQYYLFVRVDDQVNSTNVYEADGANNCRSVPFTITTPDLVPTVVTGPGSASTQQAISVSWTVKNQGTAPTVVGWSDTLYFSPNPTCCTGATSLGSSSHSTLAAGQSYTQPKTLTVPRVPAGTYYLIVRVDSGNVLSEANEGNNELATAITITTPDLAPTSLRTDPTPVLARQLISVSWAILNQGTGPTPPALTWSDTVYISPGPLCCTGATLLGSWVQSGAVPAGTSYGQTKSVTVPSLAPGTYYLIAWTDATGRIYEADDSNNRLAVPVTVTGTSAGTLAITSVNGGSHPRAGTAFPVVVEARDPSGMTRTVASSTAVSLFLGSGTGVLGGTLTGTIPAGASRVTLGGVTYTKAESGVVLIASRTSGDALAPGNSVPFTVDPGAIASYAITSSSPQPLGNTFAVSVTARDQFANTVTADSSTLVTLRSSSGHVLFDSNADGVFGDTTKALAAGTFSMNAKGTVAETTSIIAKDAKGKTGSASLRVTAASTLAFTTQPGSASAGSAIPGPPTVAVQDGFGNTVTTSTASITIAIGTNPSGGTLGGTTSKAASAGSPVSGT